VNVVPSRVNVVTLGVTDLRHATNFYLGLGWRRSDASNDEISFFDLGGVVLGLFPRAALAHDAGLPAAHVDRFGGTTLSINVASPDEVDAVIEAAVVAGASLLKAPERAVWGGYSGYFADPDGHPWEVAHNPGFPLDDSDRVLLP
jgi:uncharacterized protein